MKKFLVIFSCLIALMVFRANVIAVTPEEDSVEYVSKNGNMYSAGSEVITDNDIQGDLFAAGGSVIVKSDVQNNLIVAGGAIQVDGNVVGDVLATGGLVIINGEINGDLRVFGGEIYINSLYIGGDLYIGGGQVSISDNVLVVGDTRINAGEIDENVKTNVMNNISDITEAAKASKIFRDINLNLDIDTPDMAFLNVFTLICNFVWFIGSFIAAYLVLKLFPVYVEDTLVKMKQSPIKTLVFGLITYFVIPICVIVLAISIIGWPILIVLIMLGGLALYLAGILSSYLIGRILLQLIKFNNTGRFIPLFIGMALISILSWLLSLIPFIGGVIMFFIGTTLNAWAIGAMVENKIENMNK